jgi:hypothetical protein
MKNKGYLVLLILLLVAVIGIAVTACGSTSPLVGKWQVTGGGMNLEFSSNGTFKMWYGDASIIGTYEETGDNQVILAPDSQYLEENEVWEPVTLEYSFSDKNLILDDGTTPISFTRAD